MHWGTEELCGDDTNLVVDIGRATLAALHTCGKSCGGRWLDLLSGVLLALSALEALSCPAHQVLL